MTSTMGRENLSWSPETWTKIDEEVTAEAGRMRVAQKVFPVEASTGEQYVPGGSVQVVNNALSLAENEPKPYVEMAIDLVLTPPQAAGAAPGTVLAVVKRAAWWIAQAEDLIFFQGVKGRKDSEAIFKVKFSSPAAVGAGLLKLSQKTQAVATAAAGQYRENTFTAVTAAIAQLAEAGETGPYALFLSPDTYADADTAVGGSLTTTVERLSPLLQAGFYSTNALPRQTGLLASTGGQPTAIYVGQDLATAYTQADTAGNAHLIVSERVQIVPRVLDAFVKLEFK